MRRLIAAITVSLLLISCTPAQVLKAVTGGGGGVSANVQAGQTNSQTVGTTENVDQVVKTNQGTVNQSADKSTVKAESIEQVVNNQNSLMLILIAITGWIAPSPNEIARYIRSLFKRSKGS
jgi:type II secretory pathway component PulC